MNPIPPADQLSITVGILSDYRRSTLRDLLNELLLQINTSDEILVLNTTSNSSSSPVPTFEHPQIHYYQYKHAHFDFSRARNQIINLATKDALVFIDDDALPLPGWLQRIRTNLATFPVSGGPTLPADPLPPWWNHNINWTIGLSPPDTALAMPGNYPDTSNTAALLFYWKSHPFQIVPSTPGSIYQSGREDAEWWTNCRISGTHAIIDWRQAVCHPVHANRLSPAYIRHRAQDDGHASWLRRPHYHRATAIPWDFMHTVGLVANDMLQHPFTYKTNLTHRTWMQRQWGFLKSVWCSPISIRPPHTEILSQLARAAMFQVRIRAGRAAFNIIRRVRFNPDFPTQSPNLLYVSGHCLLGDTVLLRRHIQSLAATHPNTEIHVPSRYPALLTGLRENITIIPEERFELNPIHSIYDAAIVPYYHNANARLWRGTLAPIGRTFNNDVGFSGRRDYLYARSILTKNLDLHEHENLERLFRLWPQWSRTLPPATTINSIAASHIRSALTQAAIPSFYNILQLGAGYKSKEWSLSQWTAFLTRYLPELQTPLVLIGDQSWQHAGDSIARQFSNIAPILNLAGKTNIEELIALVASASFFIGCCSGPKHLAYMYRVPTFTIYTATEPHRWGATEDHHLHAYANAIPSKLTAMELQGLPDSHRSDLLNPHTVAELALRHHGKVTSTDN